MFPVSIWSPLRLIVRVGSLVLVAALAASGPAARADESPAGAKNDPEAAQFFESKIRPLLINRCGECHGAEKQKGALRVDSRDALLEGGDSGALIVPGKPAESLLMNVIGYLGDVKMPPKSKLPEAEIALLTQWVKMGAPWPNATPAPKVASSTETGPLFTPEQKAFWAFQPPAKPQVPPIPDDNRAKSPLDHFVLLELDRKGLTPAKPADKRTLLRRATFDLTGLPPTPEEVAAFLADESSDAFAKVIDRLLASPRYGERWGRHWLDVARYADSNGLDENLAYANAFRYRDYVIAAFNKDKPYDVFVREQIAGDLLTPSSDPHVQIERLTATGFLSLGAKMLAEDDPVKMQMDIIDEQVDTLGRTFMGLTLGCARCHDHKFDPVPTADYYSLAGMFKSTKTMENFSVVARWQERPLGTPEQLAQQQSQQQIIAGKKSHIDGLVTTANGDVLREARRHVDQYLLAAERARRLDVMLRQTKSAIDDPKFRNDPARRLIEAEDFARGNVERDTANYGKEIGVIISRDKKPDFAEYDVTIAAAGLYQLELRYAAAGARPVQLAVNGHVVKTDAANTATGSWTAESQTWSLEGFFELPAGKNTIRLERATGPFPHIDKLLLSPARTADGTPVKLPAAPHKHAYQPHPEIVQRWVKYLEEKKADPESVFALWHQFTHTAGGPAQKPGGAAAVASLIVDVQPTALEELAARYQQLFDRADAEWQALQATDKKAAALADPLQEALRLVLYAPQSPFAIPEKPELAYSAEQTAELKRQREELATLEKSLVPLPEAMAVSEGKIENIKVHIRGNHLTLGKEVPRQFPRIIAGERQTVIDGTRSGRLDLAHWLTRPDHPLTGRVMVNRVWQWHFGEGLVRSPDNFGRLGEAPSHPQLLDWLATTFAEQGWSLKSLHRLIMLSSTYQMSTAYDERAAQVDPENRLLWRMNRRRLEAEAVRDAIVAISGSLDEHMGGTLLPSKNRAYVTSTANVNPVVYDNSRRSIYLPVIRSALYEVFQAFDFADPSVPNGKRDHTTVAPQALFMMNSGLVMKETRTWAAKLLAEKDVDDTERVRLMFEQSYNRPPTPQEMTRALDYVARYTAAMSTRKADATESRLRSWQSLCRALLAANEFIYVE